MFFKQLIKLFNYRLRFFWKISKEVFEYRLGDELLELCFVHGWAVDPVVAAFPGLLDSLEDAGLPHGFEEVDDAGAADGLALKLHIHPVPDGSRVEALGARPDDP